MLATHSHVEEPATGESGEILDALLAEFEPSSEMEGGERGWDETLSHQAVEELNQWLKKNGDHSDSPPPPYDGESRSQNLSSQAMRVEPFSVSRPRGIPRHIRDQKESEEKFYLLPIVAIEPFPEGEMEWDNDGASSSSLQPVECWPRLRGRRHRFNPRQVEGPGEAESASAPGWIGRRNRGLEPLAPPGHQLRRRRGTSTNEGGD